MFHSCIFPRLRSPLARVEGGGRLEPPQQIARGSEYFRCGDREWEALRSSGTETVF